MKLIWLGLALVLAGSALPFLMVIDVLGKSFALSAFAYAASLAGLVCGIAGASRFFRKG